MTEKPDTKKKQEDTEAEKKSAAGKESDLVDSENEAAEISEDPLKDMEAKLESAQQEIEEKHDRLLRVSAEFENYKKRSSRELEEFRKYANEALIREMLPIVDNLERAVNSSKTEEQENSCVVEGVDMTLKEIFKLLEKFHTTPITSYEQPFDPNFHQAVMQEETDDYPDNIVLKELQKGYMIHDRLLRPAMVVVSKAKNNKKE